MANSDAAGKLARMRELMKSFLPKDLVGSVDSDLADILACFRSTDELSHASSTRSSSTNNTGTSDTSMCYNAPPSPSLIDDWSASGSTTVGGSRRQSTRKRNTVTATVTQAKKPIQRPKVTPKTSTKAVEKPTKRAPPIYFLARTIVPPRPPMPPKGRLGEVENRCPRCPQAFTRRSALTLHRRLHAVKRPHRCTQCKARFASTPSMKLHLARKHTLPSLHSRWRSRKANVGARECAICDAHFLLATRLRRHYRLHIGEKNFKCPMCFFTAARKRTVRRHLRRDCAQAKVFEARRRPGEQGKLVPVPNRRHRQPTRKRPVAPSATITKTGTVRKQPLPFTPPERQAYKCPMCDYGTGHRSSVNKHIRVRCKAVFAWVKATGGDRSTLNAIRNPDIAPATSTRVCEICGKVMRSKSALNYHMVGVHGVGEKKEMCSMCGKLFLHACSLERHMVEFHATMHPFKCCACEKTKPTLVLIRKHMQRSCKRAREHAASLGVPVSQLTPTENADPFSFKQPSARRERRSRQAIEKAAVVENPQVQKRRRVPQQPPQKRPPVPAYEELSDEDCSSEGTTEMLLLDELRQEQPSTSTGVSGSAVTQLPVFLDRGGVTAATFEQLIRYQPQFAAMQAHAAQATGAPLWLASDAHHPHQVFRSHLFNGN